MEMEATSGLWIIALMLLAVFGAATVGWRRGVRTERDPYRE